MKRATVRLCRFHSHLINNRTMSTNLTVRENLPLPDFNFPLSPIPRNNPLGQGCHVKTAAALIIGYDEMPWEYLILMELSEDSDEILNGKTLDSNSNYFAKFCFERGINL